MNPGIHWKGHVLDKKERKMAVRVLDAIFKDQVHEMAKEKYKHLLVREGDEVGTKEEKTED